MKFKKGDLVKFSNKRLAASSPSVRSVLRKYRGKVIDARFSFNITVDFRTPNWENRYRYNCKSDQLRLI
jgi:hypothetical protein